MIKKLQFNHLGLYWDGYDEDNEKIQLQKNNIEDLLVNVGVENYEIVYIGYELGEEYTEEEVRNLCENFNEDNFVYDFEADEFYLRTYVFDNPISL